MEGGTSALHTSFPEDPASAYRMHCEIMLEQLGLQDLLASEIERLDRCVHFLVVGLWIMVTWLLTDHTLCVILADRG